MLPQACDRIADALARADVRYGFPVLCDAGRTVVKRYGVWDPIGLASLNTAHPAAFLIDGRTRAIRYAFVGRTQFERAPLDAMLADAP